ncbi:glutamate--tRNA ligase [Neoehrlichia mikurensis]|uniref:Glutamate--tRNA ligase n=1 Tax=Neoehrlichia mikurensis TaxID=89586 RepID=A0A9Q9BV11_9RICK|nr:glutamate--tRNA ligase [Neoehrlichia mikurensis]QXK91891.1 glutamate--tRNA ligase [Neoehrlichia mikurensis]QXK93104.1 glutamate--tRNA ligase [Neoehrlichia mikurensis]QXK93584.1 glutamate--tRNA ligase [Neoehrlichia mikurensis]UTO55463.1 glutamate--tRNA ligase [Neoehrlichia mikurensis]UTO56383.1 glutamate--tRNA ligase [Neoehrlichia mikurensis]
MNTVITRFAPSPTGYLHLGGARTALFNWLFAKHYNGSFLLRIEDTDTKRSSQSIVQSILDDLLWLNIRHDGNIIFQSQNISRYIDVAHHLISLNQAYYCYCSEDEIMQQKTQYIQQGLHYKHNCPWRENTTHNQKIKKVIRLKSPIHGTTNFIDGVYGSITVNNEQMDDMIILRSNNTPTYLLAAVVDDHDMKITNVIRGADHITNTSRQLLIYNALKWDIPQFSHIPLIHDENGNKLSKRKQSLGINEYKKLGILPEAICNYLLKMGWSHGNDEIISIEQAIKWFSIQNIGLSPSRLDSKKLLFLNNHYISITHNEKILKILIPIIESKFKLTLSLEKQNYLLQGLTELKKRAKDLISLVEDSLFYIEDLPITINQEAQIIIHSNIKILPLLTQYLLKINNWQKDYLLITMKELSQTENIALKDIYHILRATITGKMSAPSIIDIMIILQKNECIKRIKYFILP